MKRKVLKEGVLDSLVRLFMTAMTKAELRNDPEFVDWLDKNHRRLQQINKELARLEKKYKNQ